MPETTQYIAVGKWENRESLDYSPVNSAINGRIYNAYGVEANHALACVPRRPYKVDQQGGSAYIMFDDDTNADRPIYKVMEV